jgi:hypothetical protein
MEEWSAEPRFHASGQGITGFWEIGGEISRNP